MRLHCFPPVVDEDIEVLILGSFPGVASLERNQYYGFGHNQFWKLVGGVLRKDLQSMAYEKRLSTLLEHHVGLWDVIASCERKGSLDTNIKGAQYNDFSSLQLPKLRLVCCNGQKTFEIAKKLISGVPIVQLPSSSPARTLPFEKKLEEWKRAFKSLSLKK